MDTFACAAPSCVIPGTVAENARFLTGKVAEVALCLFEAEACLAYGVEDLPAELRDLPLLWHVHLPVDLPWEAGGRAACAMALAVMGKVAYLQPRMAVLHPPLAADKNACQHLLHDFTLLWRQHSTLPLLLENIDTSSLVELEAGIVADDWGICLDMGHALGYGHTALLQHGALLQRVRLVHWSAPGQKDQHLPLTALNAAEWQLARQVAQILPARAHHVLEIFHWHGVEASIPLLRDLLHRPSPQIAAPPKAPEQFDSQGEED